MFFTLITTVFKSLMLLIDEIFSYERVGSESVEKNMASAAVESFEYEVGMRTTIKTYE